MIYVIQLEHNHQMPKAVETLVSEYLIKQLADNRVPEFESLQDETIFSFQYLHGVDSSKASERIVVSLRDNDIVFLCRTAKTREALITMTEEGLGPEPADVSIANPDKVLQLFFSEIIRKDFEYLEKLEDRITETENSLIMSGDENARTKIIEFRKELRRIKKYVESMDRILQGLYENENNLMTEEMQTHFRMLNRKMDRTSGRGA
jgi:Mg2+ and Co2+ transporter CorA